MELMGEYDINDGDIIKYYWPEFGAKGKDGIRVETSLTTTRASQRQSRASRRNEYSTTTRAPSGNWLTQRQSKDQAADECTPLLLHELRIHRGRHHQNKSPATRTRGKAWCGRRNVLRRAPEPTRRERTTQPNGQIIIDDLEILRKETNDNNNNEDRDANGDSSRFAIQTARAQGPQLWNAGHGQESHSISELNCLRSFLTIGGAGGSSEVLSSQFGPES